MTPEEIEIMLTHGLGDVELYAALYKKSFREFIPAAFEHAEPSTRFQHNWHIDVVADHLQAVAEGQIKRLLINVPPGTMKSLTACVLFPAWLWAREPWLRFIFSSYSEEFTKRDARKSRNLLNSEWYRAHFRTRLARGSRGHDGISVPDSILEYGTTAGGLRSSAATSSGVTGKHVHGILEDDPLKAQDVYSKASRDAAWRYHKGTLSSRLLPDGNTWRIVMMQRLHVDDVSGRILREEDGYVHLCLPQHYSPSRVKMTPLGKPDPRTEEGELLWPSRMTEEFVRDRVKDMGPHDAAAQEEQSPTNLEGGIIKASYFAKRWTKATLPSAFDVEWISCDPAVTDTNDAVAIQHWGYTSGAFYLLRRFNAKIDFVKTVEMLIEFMRLAGPQGTTMAKVIENKANGHPIHRVLRDKVPGLMLFDPGSRDKLTRLNSVSAIFASGSIVLPDVTEDASIGDYIEQICGFPNVVHDDEVDATTQGLLYFQTHHEDFLSLSLDGGFGEHSVRDPSMTLLNFG